MALLGSAASLVTACAARYWVRVHRLRRMNHRAGLSGAAKAPVGRFCPFSFPVRAYFGLSGRRAGRTQNRGFGSLRERHPRRAIQVLVWHYHDDLVPAAALPVSLSVKVPADFGAQALLTHLRADETHGDAYTVWMAQGKPATPSATQIQQLKDGMQPGRSRAGA